MSRRSFCSLTGLLSRAACLAIPVVLLAAAPTYAQSANQSAGKSTWKAPRTADGHPDLQGNWTNATITPVERPTKYGDRLVLTAAEVAELEGAEAAAVAKGNEPTDPKLGIKDLPVDCGRGFTGTNCGYNGFWVDPGTHLIDINGEKRSSMIVDPPNGRVPTLAGARGRGFGALAGGARGGRFDGPESLSLGERCLMSFGSSAGPPMLPLLYNNNYQIVQSKDTVLILVEMVHDARIVRINGKPRPANVRQWMGDSIGRFEGDTLVVETTNFHPLQRYRGANENLKITERFTRIAPNKILYKFTVEDPTTFSQPWSGELAMNASNEKIYEYACHEGNYALPGILAGAREDERKTAAQFETK